MEGKTTGQVAEMLGTTEARIQELIRYRKLSKPEKVRGKRRWGPKDIERARVCLERNS